MEEKAFHASLIIQVIENRIFFNELKICTLLIDNVLKENPADLFQSKQDNSTLFKVWVMLYTCPASRAVILDLTPHLDSHSFIRSFFDGSLLDVAVQVHF